MNYLGLILAFVVGVAAVMFVGFIVGKIFGQPAGFIASTAAGIAMMGTLLNLIRQSR